MSKRELLSSNQLYHSNGGITNRAWCVRWNHKGGVLASCGDDKNIKLWKLTEGAPPYVKYSSTLSGSHSRTIRSVAFSPSDQMLASCGFDAAIVLYELIDNEYTEVGKLEGHENEVKCCAFSPSGEFLASCSRDKSVWFWQLDEDEDFQVASILQPHTQDVKFVVWHPNEELLVSCSYDCSIKFFKYDGDDWITQQKIDSAHGSTVWSADFSADGESLVTVGGDSVIKHFEAADFVIEKLLLTFDNLSPDCQIWEREKRNMPITSSHWHCVCSYKADTRWPLYTVSWNHFNNIIAVGGGDQNLRLLRVEEGAGDGQMRTLVEYGAKRKFASEINSLAWNPHDANLLALAEDTGQIHIVNLVDM
ncbi:unnamed protein product [Anisakis simplex]|uniref:Probable cytosolic iron-sulfur protein assembly protein CIAO1 homolog n=1 Tax=Anisakis simplex TaxID=6269 RepID=A0A0M3K234_ANISI|nr:unnamed protein product [Anisakis simplex]